MTWYKSGTVTVTNGSGTVTGAGTAFVGAIVIGDAFQGPDGRSYEIAAIVSATELTLARPYLGATGGGQAYTIQPTSSFASDLAGRVIDLIGSFAAVRDGVGRGLFGDGAVTTPGIRFLQQQDTGLYRDAASTVSIATAGVRAARASPAGLGFDAGRGIHWLGNASEILMPSDGVAGWVLQTDGSVTVRTIAGVVRFAIGADGRLLAPTGHVLARPGTTENQTITGFGYDSGVGIQIRIASGAAGNAGACAFWVNANSTNGRSINAGGTVNANGADYAEYLVKADGCGTIAAGDVCGVNRDGKLTRTWADAIGFVVKSTAPAYVGGDSWAADLPPRPAEDSADLAAWEARFEAARVTVDRIAFCGQVPVNLSGPVSVGDYLVAAQAGDGISAIAVAEADISFAQYRRRLGKVWAIRDGRPWIDVQHG